MTAVSDRDVQEAEGAASRRGLVVCLRKVAPPGRNSWEMVEATVVDSRPLTETWPRPSIEVGTWAWAWAVEVAVGV